MTGMAAESTPRLPRLGRLGRYDVIAKLGQGGMAEVYLGVARGEVASAAAAGREALYAPRELNFRKLVVLKVLHQSLTGDEHFVEMFMTEARIAARLAHPNVVHTYTVGQEEGRYCIVMEYLEGVPLNALLKRTRALSFEDRMPLLWASCQVLSGLHYVHEFKDYDGAHLRLVHRDIKPSNIFLTYDGQVKVLDFGLAKMTSEHDSTTSQVVKGTVQYMSPEALDLSRTVDRRADVFAAGLLIWEVACGRRVWGEANHLQILRGLAAGELPDLEAGVESGVPQEIVRICQRAIAPQVEDRYSTALEFRLELEACMGSYAGSAATDELGALVTETFGDLRERRAQAIRERLDVLERSRSMLQSPDSFGDSPPSFTHPGRTHVGPVTATLQTTAVQNAIDSNARERRLLRWLAVAVAAATSMPIAALGTYLYSVRATAPGSSTSPVSAPSLASPSNTEAAVAAPVAEPASVLEADVDRQPAVNHTPSPPPRAPAPASSLEPSTTGREGIARTPARNPGARTTMSSSSAVRPTSSNEPRSTPPPGTPGDETKTVTDTSTNESASSRAPRSRSSDVFLSAGSKAPPADFIPGSSLEADALDSLP